jgi:hypothetical protein
MISNILCSIGMYTCMILHADMYRSRTELRKILSSLQILRRGRKGERGWGKDEMREGHCNLKTQIRKEIGRIAFRRELSSIRRCWREVYSACKILV